MKKSTSSKPKFEKPGARPPVSKKLVKPVANPIDYAKDPEYQLLIEHYQQAEFDKCVELMDGLEKKYPRNRALLKFKNDLQMKLSFESIAVNKEESGRIEKRKWAIRTVAIVIIGVILVMSILFVSYFFINKAVIAGRVGLQSAQLTSLYDQAEQLLLAGQPQPAADIVEKMISIDPNFEKLPELKSQTDALLQMETEYQTALDLIAEDKQSDALVILKQIESKKPGMWDVSHRIASIESSIQIADYKEKGNVAYQEEKWAEVITAYENALALDPQLNDPLMKDQLVNAYLKDIIGVLNSGNISTDDIDRAEENYRKASALIPQDKAFTSEREQLINISKNLLELKFIENTKAILNDKNQTSITIAKAVSYLGEVARLKPGDASIQLELQNAKQYQTAFQNFASLGWVSAIANLNQVISVDANYANGNAKVLLYEAYYTLGKNKYASGSYQDARKNLEQAEILAWDQSKNIMKLFQVQALLGDTMAKAKDYKNAVSYYQHALNAINASRKLASFSAINAKYAEANKLAGSGDFLNASAVYQDVLKGIGVVFSISDVEIREGVCLALFADKNLSAMDAVIEANDLPNKMIITSAQILKVPRIVM